MSSALNHPTKMVLLAGGKGTRLSELTSTVPKPAVDVLGRPLITYLCDWAFSSGITTVIIAAGYKQATLKRRLIDHYELAGDVSMSQGGLSFGRGGIPDGCNIIIRDTGPEADTAERLHAVRDLLASDARFMCTYGDTLTDLDAAALIAGADGADKPITMCIGRPDGRYGEIKTCDGIVTEFQEKRTPEFYVNRGFFVMKTSIFDGWRSDFVSLERDVIPYYVARGDVAAHRVESWFHSVDSVKDLQELELHLARRNSK